VFSAFPATFPDNILIATQFISLNGVSFSL